MASVITSKVVPAIVTGFAGVEQKSRAAISRRRMTLAF